MKFLKELFSLDDDGYAPADDDDEFDFDFDFEHPDMDQELDFNDKEGASGFGEDEFDDDNDEFGSEEDYPEGMRDMPHDDYDDDGEGGLVDDDDQKGELDDIKSEIESLYARLGKLAAAGDLNLLDGEPDEDEEFDGEPDFSSFQDVDMGYEDETMSRGYDGGDMDFDMDDENGADFDQDGMDFDQGEEDVDMDFPVDDKTDPRLSRRRGTDRF